jgi:hypothetical protein
MSREIRDYTSEFLLETDEEYGSSSETTSKHDKSLQYDDSFLIEAEITLSDLIDEIIDEEWMIVASDLDEKILVQTNAHKTDEVKVLEIRSANLSKVLNSQKRFGPSFLRRRMKSLKNSSLLEEKVAVETMKIVSI